MRKLSRPRGEVASLFRVFASLVALIVFGVGARGETWPQFLGPRRDGTYVGALAKTWPKEGPKQVWEVNVGYGFAGPVVADGKVFLFHRPMNEERLECFDAVTGKSVWSSGYAATYRDDFGFDPGPRSAPTVANGRVFTYGPDGIITGTEAATGKRLWQVDAKKEFGSKKGFFGRSCAPLVFQNSVLLDVGGGPGAGIVALDVTSGKTLWKSGDDEASYSSPTLAVFDGKTNALFLTRHNFVIVDPTTGKTLGQYPFSPTISASVTAATPLVDGKTIFISASYGAGAAALVYDGGQLKKIWAEDDVLSNHYSTCVLKDGFLFGFDGRQEQSAALACVNLRSGKGKWVKQHYGTGSLILAGDRLLILLETGELILAEANPEKYVELERAQILGSQMRAYPALADGFLYARDRTKLVKIDLSK